MVLGVGVDSVEIARVATLMKRPGAMDRLFTRAERDAFAARGDPAESVAGSFAAKEAVSKALGMRLKMRHWKQIEILHLEHGCPTAKFSGEPFEIAKQKNNGRVLLSIAHDKSRAIAFAIMEGNRDGV